MEQITIGLAGQVIEITCFYPDTIHFLKEYRICSKEIISSRKESDRLHVEITEKHILFEREKSEREDKKAGIPVRKFSDEYLETLAVYRQIAEQMVEKNVLLFHGSVIAVDGKGYLFTAKSGTGKSTHARLWREVFGDRAIMVNDDKPLLIIQEDGEIIACGTPWDGKHRLSNNIQVPLHGIAILKRCDEAVPDNQIKKISKREAYAMLLQQSYHPKSAVGMKSVLDMVERLGANVPLYEMHCKMEHQAAIMAYETMSDRG